MSEKSDSFLLFHETFFFDFSNYDDNIYITSNKYVQNLNLSNIVYILTNQFYGHYFPVTLLIHSIEHFFFGLNPFVFHAVSVFIHLFNTFILFHLLKTLKFTNSVSIVMVLIFAISPLQVESVSWLGARNNLLSSFFMLTSLLFYAEYNIQLFRLGACFPDLECVFVEKKHSWKWLKQIKKIGVVFFCS